MLRKINILRPVMGSFDFFSRFKLIKIQAYESEYHTFGVHMDVLNTFFREIVENMSSEHVFSLFWKWKKKEAE